MSVTFNSVTFPLATSEIGELPTRDKIIDFPGVDGIEVLPMGRGQREIVVRGVTTGTPSRSDLEGLADNERHTLSIEGDSYDNVRCVGVGPFRKVTTTDGLRTYFTVRFRQEVPD